MRLLHTVEHQLMAASLAWASRQLQGAEQKSTCSVLPPPGDHSRAVVEHAVAMSSCVLALGILQGCPQTSRRSLTCSLLSLPDRLLPPTLGFSLAFALLLSTCRTR